MLEITKGYKVGKAVMFYDLTDCMDKTTTERVPKDQVVKACDDGQISNAKVQWWQGNPIVRCTNKNLPLIKLDNSGNIVGEAQRAIRNASAGMHHTEHKEVEQPVKIESKVVGKLNTTGGKKVKQDIQYGGYDKKYADYQHQLRSTVDVSKLKTINDLFNMMAADFNLKNVEVYRNQVEKKMSLNKKLEGMHGSQIAAIQESLAVYMMNMASNEINETYIKYRSIYTS